MKKIASLAGSLLMALCCLPFTIADAAPDIGKAYTFSFPSLADGLPIDMAQFRGSVVLVVNTASECGFTAQYDGLQKLYDTYKDRKFVVLGVPSNDFGNQEPDDEKAIKKFCAMRFGITFPMTGKTHVKGSDAAPFYRWAAKQVSIVGTPKWNFHKYLIGPDGQLVDWFSSATPPTSPKMITAIEKILL